MIEETICIRVIDSVALKDAPLGASVRKHSQPVVDFCGHLVKWSDRLLPELFYEDHLEISKLKAILVDEQVSCAVYVGWTYLRIDDFVFRVKGEYTIDIFVRLMSFERRDSFCPRLEIRGDVVAYFFKEGKGEGFSCNVIGSLKADRLSEEELGEAGLYGSVAFKLSGQGQFRLACRGNLVCTREIGPWSGPVKKWEDLRIVSPLCRHFWSRYVFVEREDEDFHVESEDVVFRGIVSYVVTRSFFIEEIMLASSQVPDVLLNRWTREIERLWDEACYRSMHVADLFVFVVGALRRIDSAEYYDERVSSLKNKVQLFGRYCTLMAGITKGILELDSPPNQAVFRGVTYDASLHERSFLYWLEILARLLPDQYSYAKHFFSSRRVSRGEVDYYVRSKEECLHTTACSCCVMLREHGKEFVFPLQLQGRFFVSAFFSLVEKWQALAMSIESKPLVSLTQDYLESKSRNLDQRLLSLSSSSSSETAILVPTDLDCPVCFSSLRGKGLARRDKACRVCMAIARYRCYTFDRECHYDSLQQCSSCRVYRPLGSYSSTQRKAYGKCAPCTRVSPLVLGYIAICGWCGWAYTSRQGYSVCEACSHPLYGEGEVPALIGSVSRRDGRRHYKM